MVFLRVIIKKYFFGEKIFLAESVFFFLKAASSCEVSFIWKIDCFGESIINFFFWLKKNWVEIWLDECDRMVHFRLLSYITSSS